MINVDRMRRLAQYVEYELPERQFSFSTINHFGKRCALGCFPLIWPSSFTETSRGTIVDNNRVPVAESAKDWLGFRDEPYEVDFIRLFSPGNPDNIICADTQIHELLPGCTQRELANNILAFTQWACAYHEPFVSRL